MNIPPADRHVPCRRGPGLWGSLALLYLLGAALGLWSWGTVRMAERVPAPDAPPAYLVILPAGGVPDPTTLSRLWTGAKLARRWPEAKVVVTLATDGDPWQAPVGRMADELVLRGVPKEAILFETTAKNTAGHAAGVVAAKFGDPATDRYVLVTSRFHLYRSWRVFQEAGFAHLSGVASEEGERIDTLGAGAAARYVFWDELIAGILLLREGVALTWYHLTGAL